MPTHPALFLSHGAPTLILEDRPARHAIEQLGGSLPRPTAIVVASAHWLTKTPMVTGASAPETIHDFGGFPAELYRMQYAAPGAPELASRIAALLPGGQVQPTRGLDHGAWVPLKLMYPLADIPVVQISLQPDQGPRHHYELGRALASLRDEGVLMIGSGSLTHNLYELGNTSPEAVHAATAFSDWINKNLLAGHVDALLDYRAEAPFAAFNHPTDEHLLPLFVALGAGADSPAQTLHRSFDYGILAMDAYGFW